MIGAIVLVAMLPGAGFASSGSQTDKPDRSAQPSNSWKDKEGGFWAVGTPSDSFEKQIVTAASSKAEKRDAVRVLEKMRTRAKRGHDLQLAAKGGPTRDLAIVNDALRALRSGGVVARDIPKNYPVRGHAERDRRHWTFRTIIAAKHCDPQGCEQTDKIRVRWGWDPGRHGDRVIFNARYFPKTGAFKNIYARAAVWCGQSMCARKWIGKGGKQNGNGSGIRTLSHRNMAGRYVTDLVRFRAHFRPSGKVIKDRARTKSARCMKGSRRYCRYPKN